MKGDLSTEGFTDCSLSSEKESPSISLLIVVFGEEPLFPNFNIDDFYCY